MTDDRAVLTTGAAYRSFEQASINIECWVRDLPLRITLCSENQVKKRIVQQLVQMISLSYIDDLKRIDACNKTESVTRKLSSRNFSFYPDSGKITLPIHFLAYQISVFFYLWSRLLLGCVLKFCTSKPRKTVPSTFLFEAGGGYETDDTRFLDFCANGPIRPLSEAKRLIVFSLTQPAKQANPENVVYSRQPLVAYFDTYMSKRDQLRLLASHLYAPVIFLQALFRHPILALVASDCSCLSAYSFLSNARLLQDVVITNSFFPSQLLWMKGLEGQCYRLHMLWYSQNFIPKQYIGEERGSNLPSARHMRVDTHWVWTSRFKRYLKELGQTNHIHVVGPLLWYLRSREKTLQLAGNYSVVLFDVTPLIVDRNTFGDLCNYYSLKTISKFVSDSLLACQMLSSKYGIDIRVYLKHKRVFGRSHDSRYQRYLQRLVAENPSFRLLEPDSDLFQLIGATNLSISVPYTSTVHVSAVLNKKAIYYDASEDLVPAYEATEYLTFASNYSELVSEIEKCLLVDK